MATDMDSQDIEVLRHTLYPIAAAAGVSDRLIDCATMNLQLDCKVRELAECQPEHTHSVGRYVDGLVSAERIATGRAMWELHRDLLNAISRTHDLPAPILLSIWGIESNFGSHMGNFSVLRSLATLIVLGGRRQSFWCEQFVAAVQMCQQQNLSPAHVTGSWAGAMGHMQFMPTTYRDFAVDFDGDGCADIWSSVADALASAANYLRKSGWQNSFGWGMEIELPDDFDFIRFADGEPRQLNVWQEIGVQPSENKWSQSQDDTAWRLLLPSGVNGPTFLVTRNFDVILAYNAAMSYAIAVVHLADRIAGKNAFEKQWPNDSPLTLKERKMLQQSLVARGYDTGGVDGVLGRASRAAIRRYQIANGLIADGFASRELLECVQKNYTLRGPCQTE